MFEYFKQKTHYLRILSVSHGGKIVLESIKLYNRFPPHLNLKITKDSKFLQQSLSYTDKITQDAFLDIESLRRNQLNITYGSMGIPQHSNFNMKRPWKKFSMISHTFL